MRVLGVVPARAGSRGIPRKNVRRLGGRPLLSYTADAAFASGQLARVILSTDSDEIADVGRACGLDVPFLRAAELAADTTPMLPVVQHAVATLEAGGDSYDAVCLLQPSHPFRGPDDIVRCVRMIEQEDFDAVMTVLPVPHEYNPHWIYMVATDGTLRLSTGESAPIPRRQDLPPAFHREGSVYLVRRDVLMERNSLYGSRLGGCEVAPGGRVNLDTEADWQAAERYLAEHAAR